jgi:hypothetical protein
MRHVVRITGQCTLIQKSDCWRSYNSEVTHRLSKIVSDDLAAKVFDRPRSPREPEGFDFRFCLPGSPVLQIYRDRRNGQLVAFQSSDGVLIRHPLFDRFVS